ncbi:maleylpyruvate isomerase family mycothiol-dependent enzyme [Falsarthrobacter nasiphocae]|uniref:Uncharacterized protein (TIGR03083 family) n=1 Tax=Falsarthrobacter nasiphocae TaxID=189863 RepID=A0AAE3YE21_9MICC|nr:maleylpyruvate isomerase family mycothiol-dependent enzyme [Falsarthrobacter nasiphocae]MDR6891674.1 uncharacterized protein (TIGR03083 family) [Falsarthrobacter nasiphocae]
MANPDVMWPRVIKEREALAEDLAGLTNAQWATRSLCSKWTVQNLVVHLISGFQVTKKEAVLALVRHGFNFSQLNDTVVSSGTHVPPSTTLEQYRAAMGRESDTFKPEDALAEIMIHSADIRIPLGLEYEPSKDNLFSLAASVSKRPHSKRLRDLRKGLRFTATDQPWSLGSKGPEVKGPMLPLLLALCGREAGLEQLEGDGLTAFRARFSH